LEGDGSKGDKYDSTISRRWGDVQRDEWRNDYEIVVKVRNLIYNEKPLQQAVSQKITIWTTYERMDHGVGAFKLLQQDDQRDSNCLCQDQWGG